MNKRFEVEIGSPLGIFRCRGPPLILAGSLSTSIVTEVHDPDTRLAYSVAKIELMLMMMAQMARKIDDDGQ